MTTTVLGLTSKGWTRRAGDTVPRVSDGKHVTLLSREGDVVTVSRNPAPVQLGKTYIILPKVVERVPACVVGITK